MTTKAKYDVVVIGHQGDHLPLRIAAQEPGDQVTSHQPGPASHQNGLFHRFSLRILPKITSESGRGCQKVVITRSRNEDLPPFRLDKKHFHALLLRYEGLGVRRPGWLAGLAERGKQLAQRCPS